MMKKIKYHKRWDDIEPFRGSNKNDNNEKHQETEKRAGCNTHDQKVNNWQDKNKPKKVQ